MIISIFGPDGVGKTTHANMLVYKLSKQGYKVRKVWIKNNHTITYLIVKLLEYISRHNVVKLPTNMIITNILACSNKLNKRFWLWMDFIGVLIKFMFSVYVPKILGFIIIADRYLPDTIVAMSLTVRDLKVLKTLPVKLLLSRLIKDNTMMIMLDCDYVLIKSRRAGLIEPQSLISWQKIAYRTIAKILNAPVIQTNKNINEVHTEILRIIKTL